MTHAAGRIATALVLALVSPPHVWGGAPTDALRDTLAGVNRALDDPELRKAPADLRAAVRTALVSRIDALEAARLALGDGWMARTPAEREEFTAVFGDHFERTYIFRIAAHAPMYRPLAIRYLDEKSDGGTATVATTLGNREGGEVPVEYRLIQRDGRPTAPGPAPAAPPSVAAPTPLASSPAAVTSSGNSELARLVADHAARAGTTEKPPAPEPTAAYWLQVGAFKNRDVAGGLAARLRARSLPVSVDSVTAPAGTPLTRVRVGPFADQAEAAAKLRELQTSGYRPFLAVERKSN